MRDRILFRLYMTSHLLGWNTRCKICKLKINRIGYIHYRIYKAQLVVFDQVKSWSRNQLPHLFN